MTHEDEHSAALRLEFDRGTILCSGAADHRLDPTNLPGMRWDERVGSFRAPARFWSRIVAELRRADVPFVDSVPRGMAEVSVAKIPELRPYQAAALDAWRLAHRRGVVVLPTGSGKTRVALTAIAEERKSALCLVPTRILLEQWRAAIGRELGLAAGCYGDGEHTLRPITVATFESAYRHMHELGNRFELLVVDEAHHFGRGERDEALDMCIAPWRLGLTATPPQDEALQGLAERIGPRVYSLGIADLAGLWLADFELIELRLELGARERRDYEEAWSTFARAYDRFRDLAPGARWDDFLRWAARTEQGRSAVAAWRAARRILALTETKSAAIGALLARHRESRVLVFTADQQAAYRVAREHLVMPITADIRGAERDLMLQAFREGAIRALVSARVLNEGFDVPTADVGIIAGGALGEREHVQRVGRLLRPAPGKRALVYELVTLDTVEVRQARRRRSGVQPSRARAL